MLKKTVQLMVLLNLGLLPWLADAQVSYPTNPIRLIVPLPAGTIPDISARVLAQNISEQFGESIVVENAPGASTSIGAGRVARARPDGYTLLLTTNQHVMLKELMPGTPFDPIEDFVPITPIIRSDLTLTTSSDGPFDSYETLISVAREQPDSLTYSTPGIGSPAHLACAAVLHSENVTARHIPFKGSTEAITALISGVVDFTCPAVSNVAPMVSGGKVRILATTGPQRHKLLPTVRTAMEITPNGPRMEGWMILLAPKGLSRDIQEKLNDVVTKAIDSEEFQKLTNDTGGVIASSSLAQASEFFASEAALSAQLISSANASQ